MKLTPWPGPRPRGWIQDCSESLEDLLGNGSKTGPPAMAWDRSQAMAGYGLPVVLKGTSGPRGWIWAYLAVWGPGAGYGLPVVLARTPGPRGWIWAYLAV